MGLKPGDVVIKKTGGNKMTIQSVTNGLYHCFWFIGSILKEQTFSEGDIVTLDDYKRYLKIEEREDKINQIFRV
jgi:uncharacterized protein YodC (DUF2158 family)